MREQTRAPHRTFCVFSFLLSSQFHYSAEGYETSIRVPASLDYESCARCYLVMFMPVLLWLRQLHCWRSVLRRAVVAADVVSAPLRRVHQMPQIFISSFLGLAFFVCDFILFLSNTIYSTGSIRRRDCSISTPKSWIIPTTTTSESNKIWCSRKSELLLGDVNFLLLLLLLVLCIEIS